MRRKNCDGGVFLMLLVVESVFLVMVLQRLAYLEDQCGNDTGPDARRDATQLAEPTIYVITPTYRRSTQLADMTRMAQTLMHIPNLHWIVVEDAEETSEVVRELLERTRLPFTHLCASTPLEYRNKTMLGRGVFNRREGLRWLRQEATHGVLYFADDDNSYDVRLFHQIRQTKKASVFPVGMILELGVSSPIVRGGKVVGFHDAFQGGRKFALDMAGFAVNLRLLHANPTATVPHRVSYLEDGFLRRLRLELEDLEPLASGCTEVLVWHTKTQRGRKPNMDNVPGEHFDTNLVQLYRHLLR
nr:galactosylgalactosylxylosylprotein 3-beta-glucuronosyltransferase S-like [Procambarus clarkii]